MAEKKILKWEEMQEYHKRLKETFRAKDEEITAEANNVYFDDGTSLEEKYVNGELGGGTVVDDEIILTYITNPSLTIAVGSTASIEYNFVREQYTTRKGAEKIFVDGVLKKSTSVSQGDNTATIENLGVGTHNIEIVISSSGLESSLVYAVEVIELTINSTFDGLAVYTNPITYRYTPVGNIEKTIHFIIDNEEYGTAVVVESNKAMTYEITGLSHGSHSLVVYATATIGEDKITSNILKYDLVVNNGGTKTIIGCPFDIVAATQGDLLTFKYVVFTPDNIYTDVTLSINGTSVANINVDRSQQTWNVRDYPVGSTTFTITANGVSKTFTVEVSEAQINIEPITHNLELHLTSANRSNTEAETEREVWENNGIKAQFSNFNWKSNGWVSDSEGNTALRINGDAKVTIPYKLFATDFRSNGKVIEFEFATSDIRDYDSILINCMSNNRGFSLTSNIATMKSEQTEIETKFKEDEKVRVAFVFEPTSENRLVYTYINGIISGLAQYPSDDDFTQTNPIGITIGSTDATIDIYNIRVYNINLDHRDILMNYIADTPGNEKITLYNFNDVFDSYGNISYSKVLENIPCLTIIGELPATKGDKKTVNIQYVNLFDSTKDFTAIGATLDIQGTSSQYYPRKNYKFKLTFFYKLTDNSIEEQVFCLKADYMESSHSHNTGLAKIVNSLYPETPASAENELVQAAITGFPIVVWHQATISSEPECLGVYNFNNDKDDVTTFGYTESFPNCESWEFKNNTSAHCLFQSDDFTDTEEVAKNFEARYPDKFTDYTNLSRVVSWVYSTRDNLEKFKNEFEDYFNLDSMLLYYCLTELFAMVDSRAKNFFLTTWDGDIWYATFYDMDTAFGLNNEGVNDFDYNVEYHDTQGSQNVFNGESSVLWNNFEEAYAEEITTFYNNLRNNNRVTYESVMNVLYGEQISKISENNYNYDAVEKYKNPLVEDGIGTYLYTAQGSRLEHLKWWLFNRLNYMDSKYVASDYKDDYMTLRIYTPSSYGSVVPNANAYITPYADQYVTVKYDENEFSKRGTHDVETIIEAPNQVFNDTPMIIYGASRISSIGDLSPLYPGTVDVSSGVKLKELKIGNAASDYSNTNLAKLTIGNNELLKKLDVRNCPNLTEAIDASGCINIEEIYAEGTSTTAVKVPNGGNLKILHLPNTVTNITIQNQKFITDFTCAGYSKVNTLRIENSSVDSLSIVMNSMENLNLTRVRLLGVNWEVSSSSILEYLKECAGIDDSGFNQTKSVLTGKVHIKGTILSTLIDEYQAFWGTDLTITADTIVNVYKVNFFNYDGSLLYTTSAFEGTYVTYEGETPTKPNDDTYYYEFSNWSPGLDDAIFSDTNYIAEYTQHELLTVIWTNWDGTELQRNGVRPNETVSYISETPTKADDEMYKDYILTNWLGSDGNTYEANSSITITQDITLTAHFEGTPQEYTVNWYSEGVLLLTTIQGYGTTASYSGETPTHSEGYLFTGWSRTSDSNIADEDLTITGETNLYAVFDKPDTLEIKITSAVTPSYTLASCTGADEEITIDWGDGDVATYTVTTSGTVCTKPNAYATGYYTIKMPATENYKITAQNPAASYDSYRQYINVSFKYLRIEPSSNTKEFFFYQTLLESASLGMVSNQIGITTFPYQMFSYCTKITSFDIPEGATRTGYSMFSDCSNLTNIKIPSSVKCIDAFLTSSNRKLTSIEIPASVTEVCSPMFSYCYALETITMLSETPPTFVEDGSGTSYNSGAFSKCNVLTYIIVPSLEAIEKYNTTDKWATHSGMYISSFWFKEISNQILSLDSTTTKDITLTYFGNNPTFTAVSDNTSICNASANGNVVTITAVGVGTANITVTMNNEDETFTRTFIVNILETIPVSTYTVEAIDGVTYGFTLNDSGYYESTNQAVNSSFSLCKVSINASGYHTLYLDCINSGESNYDFGILSNLDTTLNAAYAVDSTNVFKSFKGLSNTNVQTVDYGVIPAGEHFIYVKFRKDSSGNSGNDSLQFQVRLEL